MTELDYHWTPDAVAIARFNAYGFLSGRGRAEALWTRMLEAGEPVWAPPDVPDQAPADRARWLADAQADRIARARLFLLEGAAGDLAIQAGGDVRAGHLDVRTPPTPYGLLFSPAGLGYSADGMELLAAHWGPYGDQGDYWVTWWADAREFLRVTGEPRSLWPVMLQRMGSLYYVSSGLFTVREHDDQDQEYVQAITEPHPDHDDGDAPEMTGMASTLWGAWWALTLGAAAGALEIDRVPAPVEITERGRAVGILPSKITRGYLHGVTPDRLWDYDAGPVR